MSGRLIAVSNRVGPLRGAISAGGLAVGLVEALREHHGVWFGWSGSTSPAPAEEATIQQVGDITQALVDVSSEDYDAYYNGYANGCLWPIFHFRVDLSRYEQRHFEAYRRVNQRFARALRPLLAADDSVWAHDYHLFLLAAELRALGVRQRLGFFLHIPFPPRDILVTLPNHERLMRALFHYDLVGFQTAADVERFQDYVKREAGGQVSGARATAYGRQIEVGAFPIGIDVDNFRKLAFSRLAERECVRMREALRGRDQIICVDRLDYSKGLLRRIRSYEALLERHPDARSRVELLQVAPTSRGEVDAYREFREDLEQAAAHINGDYAQLDWTPMRYLNRALPRRTLAWLYRASRIGLVTPVRDGMNLVAKEYVAAQDPADPGVLVLSRFAGAAQQMRAALLVNPYDPDETAEALQRARKMDLEERRTRHADLMRGLIDYDVRRWRDEFMSRLTNADSEVAWPRQVAMLKR